MSFLSLLDQLWTSKLVNRLSLWVSILTCLGILFFSVFIRAEELSGVHRYLMIAILGSCVLFISGVGFKPDRLFFRTIFHPLVGFAIVFYGLTKAALLLSII